MQKIESNSRRFFDNTWEKITPKDNLLPEPRSGHASVISMQTKTLYIFGGYTDKDALNDMHAFDLENEIWKKVEYLNKENDVPSSNFSRIRLLNVLNFIENELQPL